MPVLRDLSQASRQLFSELADEEGFDFGLKKRGLMMLCKTQKGLDEEAEVAEQAEELGVEAEVLDAEGVAARDPAIKMDVAGGVFFPQDCHLAPTKFLASLTAEITRMGGEFVRDVEIDRVEMDGDRVRAVAAGKRLFEADEYVVAGGSWSPALGNMLGVNLPMQAGKGYSMTLEDPVCLPDLCSILVEAKVAVTPMGSAVRFGGTMEICGLDESINRRRVRGIVKSIPRFFPAVRGGALRW